LDKIFVGSDSIGSLSSTRRSSPSSPVSSPSIPSEEPSGDLDRALDVVPLSSMSFSTAGDGCSSSASSCKPSLQILQNTGSDGKGAAMTGGDSPSSYMAISFMATEVGNTIPVRRHDKVELDSYGSDEKALALSCGSSSLF
jgi:hypothetical protein